MILIGNQRGGGRDLALHLLKEENDHVRVHELRGFIADDLEGAFKEAHAISRGTRCKQFLFSLSINPPADKEVSTGDFEAAIDRIEQTLNLSGQPRAIVFHEKEGRRHAHAVWSRIKADEMKAVQMSYSGEKLLDVSRELHIQHGFKMPRGLLERSERDPRNFTLEEWQHAKRVGADVREIKTHIQDAWVMSDSKTALKHALEARGYRLARGDKRGYVAIDYRGEAYSLARYAGVKTKEARTRLGDPAELPSVDEAKAAWASDLLKKTQDWQRELDRKRQVEQIAFQQKRNDLVRQQRAERDGLAKAQALRQSAEAQVRQARFRKGLGGLWDRLRGEHRRITERNLREAETARQRDVAERDKLTFQQLAQRRDIVKTRTVERQNHRSSQRELRNDRDAFAAAVKHHPLTPERGATSPQPARAPPRTLEAALSKTWAEAAQNPDREARREAFKAQRRERKVPARDRNPTPER